MHLEEYYGYPLTPFCAYDVLKHSTEFKTIHDIETIYHGISTAIYMCVHHIIKI